MKVTQEKRKEDRSYLILQENLVIIEKEVVSIVMDLDLMKDVLNVVENNKEIKDVFPKDDLKEVIPIKERNLD